MQFDLRHDGVRAYRPGPDERAGADAGGCRYALTVHSRYPPECQVGAQSHLQCERTGKQNPRYDLQTIQIISQILSHFITRPPAPAVRKF